MSIASKLNLKNNKWMSCKYVISAELTFSDGDVRELNPIQINGLYMEKDYDNDHLPIMMIDLLLNRLDKNKVDDKTIFHVKIVQYYLENDDQNKEKRSSKIYLDEKFVRLGYGTEPDVSEELEKKSRRVDNLKDSDLSPSDLTTQITYVLIKKSDLLMTKVTTNAVLVDVTMQDVVSWLLSYVKCDKKVLMSASTNSEVHKELLLQPRIFLEQLLYLEDEFGWYEEGAYIFIDYDKFYIIRKNGKPTAWVKNDIKQVCFCISSVNSSDENTTGVINQDNTTYINVAKNGYTMSDAAIVEDQTDGANIILVNTTTGETTVEKSGTTTLDESGTYTTKMYHGHNPYTLSRFKRMRKENDHVWDIICNNSDLSYYTPQRQFSFLSDVTKISNTLKGVYRISRLQVSFIKNGEFFNNKATIRVKRTSLT